MFDDARAAPAAKRIARWSAVGVGACAIIGLGWKWRRFDLGETCRPLRSGLLRSRSAGALSW